MDKKELVLATVSDLVSDFLYYGRKEDEELPVEYIDDMVRAGEITVDEIVDLFREKLVSQLTP